MPSRHQLLFLTSFCLTFAALAALAVFVRTKLLAAGYDISHIVLIGLDSNMSQNSLPDLSNVLAIGFALITTVFIYLRFAHARRKPVLNPQLWQEFPLKDKMVVSPNTAIYRIALPHPQDILGLPIGQHITVSAVINGKEITRSYTPTSSDDDLGHFDLLIKSYEKGNVSRWFSFLQLGDKVRIKGPKGQFRYSSTLATALGMIAGGTGITPMLQIIRAALKNPNDLTKLSLIYANVNYEDILLKKELDQLADVHPDRFRVYYVLNNPPNNQWNGGVGFVSKEQIKDRIPPPSNGVKVLMCGPPPMMTAMKKHLDELKYPAPRTVSKLVDQVFLF